MHNHIIMCVHSETFRCKCIQRLLGQCSSVFTILKNVVLSMDMDRSQQTILNPIQSIEKTLLSFYCQYSAILEILNRRVSTLRLATYIESIDSTDASIQLYADHDHILYAFRQQHCTSVCTINKYRNERMHANVFSPLFFMWQSQFLFSCFFLLSLLFCEIKISTSNTLSIW